MEDVSGDDVPLNPADLRIDTQVVSLDLLLKKLQSRELLLSEPAGAWTAPTASLFVESLLARIPTPDLYLDATHEERWTVIDGAKRLHALRSFVVEGALPLERLELFSELDGRRFSELPRNQSRRIEEAQVTVHWVEKGTPAPLALSVYRRLQPGRSALQLLSARHAGLGWRRAQELSTASSIETTLRLIAVLLDPQSLPPLTRTLVERLDWALTELARLSDDELATLTARLRGTTQAVADALAIEGPSPLPAAQTEGTSPLPAPQTAGASPLPAAHAAGASPLPAAHLEAWVTALARRPEASWAALKTHAIELASGMSALDQDAEFQRALTERTASSESFRVRLERIDSLLARVLPG